MTTALAERTVTAPMVTPEQVDLITRTVASGATADELKLYLYDCARQGVHPLDKLIHYTKRGGKYTPITSIDFMRTRAADTGEYAGSDDAKFDTFDGDQHPHASRGATPESSTVTVWRLVQGQRCPFTATARWAEYYPGDGEVGFMWRKMPHTMLAKCAEALALRKGFPRQLAGLYAKEEMDQAGEAHGGYTVTAPNSNPLPQIASSSNGRTPDFGSGDAGSTPADAATPPPTDGALRIARIDRKPTKNPNVTKLLVILSDGRELSTINTALGNLAEQLCQDGDPVEVDTKSSKWGEDLLNLRRVTREIQIDDAKDALDAEYPF